jgi:hypothetical protein
MDFCDLDRLDIPGGLSCRVSTADRLVEEDLEDGEFTSPFINGAPTCYLPKGLYSNNAWNTNATANNKATSLIPLSQGWDIDDDVAPFLDASPTSNNRLQNKRNSNGGCRLPRYDLLEKIK